MNGLKKIINYYIKQGKKVTLKIGFERNVIESVAESTGIADIETRLLRDMTQLEDIFRGSIPFTGNVVVVIDGDVKEYAYMRQVKGFDLSRLKENANM